jgi:HEAT repeat protein
MMRSSVRATLAFSLAAVFFVSMAPVAWAQSTQASGGERTVEEAYLQESLETMIIREQAYSDNAGMKRVALKYIKQAIENGRKNDEIRKSLEYLALETTNVVTRSAGLGKPTNNFPDIRTTACEYLGEFPSVESKNALIRVTLGDDEPMVLSAAIRSLGKIGMNEDEEVTQVISYIISRFDVLGPDDSLADDALDAIVAIAEKNNGLKDPTAIKAVMKIASGNYISRVRQKASDVLDKLRKYQAAANSKK